MCILLYYVHMVYLYDEISFFFMMLQQELKHGFYLIWNTSTNSHMHKHRSIQLYKKELVLNNARSESAGFFKSEANIMS